MLSKTQWAVRRNCRFRSRWYQPYNHGCSQQQCVCATFYCKVHGRGNMEPGEVESTVLSSTESWFKSYQTPYVLPKYILDLSKPVVCITYVPVCGPSMGMDNACCTLLTLSLFHRDRYCMYKASCYERLRVEVTDDCCLLEIGMSFLCNGDKEGKSKNPCSRNSNGAI